jgi:putative membrane protein
MTAPNKGTPMDPRVWLAAERTLLAWVRTALALMGLGFVVARFGLFLHEMAETKPGPPHPLTDMSLWLGMALVVLGVVVNLTAAVQHLHRLRLLKRGEPLEGTVWSLAVIVTVLLALIGSAMAVYLCLRSQ